MSHGNHEPSLGSRHTGEEKEIGSRGDTLCWCTFWERDVDPRSVGVFGHEKQGDTTPEKGGEVARFDNFVLYSKHFWQATLLQNLSNYSAYADKAHRSSRFTLVAFSFRSSANYQIPCEHSHLLYTRNWTHPSKNHLITIIVDAYKLSLTYRSSNTIEHHDVVLWYCLFLRLDIHQYSTMLESFF